MKLAGKIAIVTGAARGLGAVYARALAREGAKLVATDVLDPGPVVAQITDSGGRAIGLKSDVADAADCERVARRAIEEFGGIEILINNAARFASISRKSFELLETEEWDEVMAVNVRGPFNMAKAVFAQMKRQGRGKIINVASSTVFAGTPGMLHYVTSKGAVVAMTRALAREIGSYGITVNGLAPGLTMSEAIVAQRETIEPYSKVALAGRALKREEVPDDLVGAVIFLASSASDFMTGQTIVIDGGYVMR